MPDENVLRDPVAVTRRALIAAQDPERLEAVRQTGLLDASLQPSLQRFARLLCELLDVPISLVSLVDAEREYFTARCGVAVDAIPLEASYAKHVVAGGKPLAVVDVARDAGLADLATVKELGFGAYLGAPVHAGGHCVGALCVIDSRPRAWDERARRLVEDLAVAASSDIELRLREAQRRRMELTDALTGLGNRNALAGRLEEVLGAGEPWFLALLDLDGFKAYNDVFGHPAGDTLLARLAHRLSDAVAGDGEAFRMGGDEFCVLVRDAPLLLAAQAALRDQGAGYRITASRGSVELPGEARTMAAALGLADRRLYGAKRVRRGSIVQQIATALSVALAERDNELSGESDQVSRLARDIALALGMDSEQAREVTIAARLHDIGKMAISDQVLANPGPLDRDERDLVERHTIIGERILAAAPALAEAAKLVRSSHEYYDGSGYPDGLTGEQIPLGARIIAACDAYEAMIHERPHRPARKAPGALDELMRCAGRQFDPHVVEALVGTLSPEPLGAAAGFGAARAF